MTGFIKAVLAVERGVIPPSLNYSEPNPAIDFASTPFFVNTELLAWEPPGRRIAGVSSFGIGGTNAHAVLEQPPELATAPRGEDAQLLVLSARSEQALNDTTASLVDLLSGPATSCLEDVAHTLQQGRAAHELRRAVVVDSEDQLKRFGMPPHIAPRRCRQTRCSCSRARALSSRHDSRAVRKRGDVPG